MAFKIGDTVCLKDYPEFEGPIIKIDQEYVTVDWKNKWRPQDTPITCSYRIRQVALVTRKKYIPTNGYVKFVKEHRL